MDTQNNRVMHRSTPINNGKVSDYLGVVLYDQGCQMCAHLAGLMQKRVSTEVMKFRPNTTSKPAKLVVELKHGENVITLEDDEAWGWLLENHPTFSDLNWLAQKMGLSRISTYMVKSTAQFLRRFCRHC